MILAVTRGRKPYEVEQCFLFSFDLCAFSLSVSFCLTPEDLIRCGCTRKDNSAFSKATVHCYWTSENTQQRAIIVEGRECPTYLAGKSISCFSTSFQGRMARGLLEGGRRLESCIITSFRLSNPSWKWTYILPRTWHRPRTVVYSDLVKVRKYWKPKSHLHTTQNLCPLRHCESDFLCC